MQHNAAVAPVASTCREPAAVALADPRPIEEGQGRGDEASRAVTRRVLLNSAPWLAAMLGLVLAAGFWLH